MDKKARKEKYGKAFVHIRKLRCCDLTFKKIIFLHIFKNQQKEDGNTTNIAPPTCLYVQ